MIPSSSEATRATAAAGLGLLLCLTLVVVASADTLPPFELENWNGDPVSDRSLRGRTNIVVFTYAKCIFACPMVTFLLHELDTELGSPANLNYVHVSVNPEDDTAQEILLHFEKHDIDPRLDPRWLFLNRPIDRLGELLERVGIEVVRTPVEEGLLIDHNILVLVVSPDGTTTASFDTYYWEQEVMLNALSPAINHR